MPTPAESAALFRRAMELRERSTFDRLIRAYGEVWKATSTELERLLGQIAATRAAGEPISPAWLYRQRRLTALLGELERHVWEFAQLAHQEVLNEQEAVVEAARLRTHQLIGEALHESAPGFAAVFGEPDDAALRQLVGHLSDGSPLARLFAELPGDASTRARNALLHGVGRGLSPREIAVQMRHALGGNLARALTIARTETLRAYREASRLSYEANADVVAGWVWHAALDLRSCAACWAMHGSFHPLTETLDGHPNCRCAMVPWTKSWEDLGVAGVPDTRPSIQSGADAFAELTPSQQAAILGPRKLAALQRGDIDLSDLVGRSSSEWGTMRREVSLKQALANHGGPRDAVRRLGRPTPTPDAPDADAVVEANRARVLTTGDYVTKKPTAKSGLLDGTDEGLRSMDAVHRQPDGMPKVPIHTSRATSYAGQYEWGGGRVDAIRLSINSLDQTPLTMAHEWGHYLDRRGFGVDDIARSFGSTARYRSSAAGVKGLTGPEAEAWAKWWDAVNGSRAIQGIKALRAGALRSYYLTPTEMFARSYSQWIAVRSGSAAMRANVRARIEWKGPGLANDFYRLGQWEDDDFEPIAEALDAIFRAAGLMD